MAVAEGIEGHAQLEALRGLSAQMGQGFLFSAPSAAELAQALSRGPEATPAQPRLPQVAPTQVAPTQADPTHAVRTQAASAHGPSPARRRPGSLGACGLAGQSDARRTIAAVSTSSDERQAVAPNIRSFLTRPVRYATIATINPDGAPHQIVIWYLLRHDEQRGDYLVVNSRAAGAGRPTCCATDAPTWPSTRLKTRSRSNAKWPSTYDG